MKNKSYKIALGGIISSLCLLTMFMTGVFPVLSILIPMICGIFLMIATTEVSISYAFITYISVSLLSMIITPDKESAFLFVMFFGHYPILRFIIRKIPCKLIRGIIKALIFNICMVAFFYIITYIMGLTQFLEEINNMGKYGAFIILTAVNFIFVLYEYNLDIFYELYIRRLKSVLKKL